MSSSLFAPRRPFLTFLLWWSLLAAALIIGNRTYLFSTPVYETSDFAVNALQIDHAKDSLEIYGNYSRFHFHHPGPAFFYVYALGEIVFHDALGLTPTPHNAHVIAAILLQTACFVLALLLLSRLLERDWVLPAGLLLGVIHFAAAQRVFTSIWPPHVLLAPFLLFFAGCAGVSLQRWRYLPVAVLAGSLLVHGHVAQPLFVGGLFIAALALAVVYSRTGFRALARSYRCSLLAALAILALFLTPILIDAMQGSGSNLTRIFRHLSNHHDDGKTVLQSLLYFLLFVTYQPEPDHFLDPVGPTTWAGFRPHAYFLIFWGLAFLVVIGRTTREFLKRNPSDENIALRRRRLHLLLLWTLTALLCLVWGTRQTGPMFAFNGHFYFGVHFLIYLLAVTTLIRLLPPGWMRWLGPISGLTAVVIATFALGTDPAMPDPRGRQINAGIDDVIAADPHPDLPKMLVFDYDNWSDGATVALQLQRRGIPFRVEPHWDFMFESHRTISLDELAAPELGFSVWRFVPAPKVDAAAQLLKNLWVTFRPAALKPTGDTLRFAADGNLHDFHVAGFTTPDAETSWTNAAQCVLQFQTPPTTTDVELEIIAQPFLVAGDIPSQQTELYFNDTLVFAAPFTEPGVLRARIRLDMWNARPVATLRLHFPDARSPAQLGLYGDPRELSLLVRSLTVRPAEPMPAP